LKREEARRKKEEERRKEEEQRQKEYEEEMLKKLDIHPYLVELDICDFLLKFCKKHLKKAEVTE